MVRDSVTAYVKKDLELARDVMKADDAIDEYFEEVPGRDDRVHQRGKGRERKENL